MLCPADVDPRGVHSYIVNKLLVKNQQDFLKFGKKAKFKDNTSVVVAGEKTSITSDYYMEANIVDGSTTLDAYGNPVTEFDRVIEQARHGRVMGSNYLFFDGHVESRPPKEAREALNPWEVFSAMPPTP
jgi:prepilin-type processing-associated H-X9-DG protein